MRRNEQIDAKSKLGINTIIRHKKSRFLSRVRRLFTAATLTLCLLAAPVGAPAADPLLDRLHGIAAAQSGDHEKAVQHFTRALEATTADQAAPLLTARAGSLNALGRYPEAIDDATQALTLDPENGEAHALRGTAWRQSGETAKGLEDYKKAYGLGFRQEWMRDFMVANGVRVEG